MNSIIERIDAITGMTPEYSTASPPIPKSVKIELTARCNFACSFCARKQRLRDQGDMDWELFTDLATQMRDAGVEELGMFYLGESFQINWLESAILYAKQVLDFPYVFLTTNGASSSPERVRHCMAMGLDSLKWSFNYVDGAQLKDIAGVSPRLFDRMVENIRAAYRDRESGGYSTGLYASYIEYDGAQKDLMMKALDLIEPYVDEVYGLPLYNQAAFVTEEEKARGWKPIAGNRGRAGNLRDPLPCWSLFTEGHITWDGKLSACCFDHDDRFVMADLTKVPFVDGWNSDSFQEARRGHLARDVSGTVCEECVAYG